MRPDMAMPLLCATTGLYCLFSLDIPLSILPILFFAYPGRYSQNPEIDFLIWQIK